MYKISKLLDCNNTLFNPFWLKENHHEVHQIKVRAQEMSPYYGFPEFDNEFIEGFLKEVPHIVQHAQNMIFDWDGIDNSTSFKTLLEQKKKRMGCPVDDDWRKDAGEKAKRIWEWWKPIVIDDSNFSFFSLALRLIALIQVSSCAVERVFSQMKCVIDVCGNVYEDTLEVRMFARCNGNLTPLWMQAYEE